MSIQYMKEKKVCDKNRANDLKMHSSWHKIHTIDEIQKVCVIIAKKKSRLHRTKKSIN